MIIFMPTIRARILNARNRMVPKKTAEHISNNVDLGDWWIIYMLGRNVDPVIFKEILIEMEDRIEIRKRKK